MAFFLQIMAVVVAPLIFIVGLIKPKWVLFWMKEPDRLWSTTIALLLFMGSFTAWSEIRMPHKTAMQREHEMELKQQQQEKQKRGSPERQNELQLDRL